MPYQKKRGLNRKPITRICIRIYDEQDAEELDKAFKSSVVQTQNDFLLLGDGRRRGLPPIRRERGDRDRSARHGAFPWHDAGGQ
jgi:hypothetical protein